MQFAGGRQISEFHTVQVHWDLFNIPNRYKDYRIDKNGGGVGTLGECIKFDHPSGHSSIIVKKFNRAFSDKTGKAQMITRELNLLKTLRHPNIVRFLDSYVVKEDAWPFGSIPLIDRLYHITEYCGVPLPHVMKYSAYGLEQVKKWMKQLIEALQYLHSLEMIHRDLRPDYLCINMQNDKLTVVGFGAIRAADYNINLHSEGFTDTYLPLEMQVPWREDPTEKANIWSAATILCSILIGSTFFFGLKTVDIVQNMVQYCGPIHKSLRNQIRYSVDRRDIARLCDGATRKDLVTVLIESIKISATELLAHPFITGETLPPSLNYSSDDYDDELHQLLLIKSFTSDSSEQDAGFVSDFSKLSILSVIDKGQFGCVFKAQKYVGEILAWTRAVKRIPMKGSKKDVADSLKEVKALAELDHPGIVRFFDAWTEEPPAGWQRSVDAKIFGELGYKEYVPYNDDCAFLYIQRELCRSSLSKWLSENQNRDMEIIKTLFRQIVEAPDNILIGANGRLKICDLGIAAVCASMTSEDGTVMERTAGAGTKLYMAPEQKSLFPEYSSKVDIFAIGLILVELCVVMRFDDAAQIFDNYRAGIANTCLDHLPSVKTIVAWLTNLNDTERPGCEEILENDFLVL